MNRPADLGNLKTNEWEHLQDLTERFEAAWQKADSVELGQFLPPEGEALRNVALHELIKTDLEIRWRKGQIVGLEYYLDLYPELGEAESLPAQLIYEEYRVRQLYGDKPQLSTYTTRFPDQFNELQRLVSAHPVEGVPSAPPPPPSTVPSPKASKPSGPPVLQVGAGYKLIKCIGRGSFGEVWRAEAPGGVEVAMKIINRPMDHKEAKRELEALETVKLLRHPLLLQIQGFWALEERLVIAMELADGNLRDRLKECRVQGLPGIPPAELLKYFRQSAEALDYLHSQKVQHRDVKPDNILLLQGHAKLADFGLARALESRGMVTATGSGTPPYMAPEVWRGRVCEHSDQYSLACSYAELRLNRRLYADRELMQVMLGHLKREPDLSPLSQSEQKVIFKALSKEPEQRYPTCTGFVQALELALRTEVRRSGDFASNLPRPGKAGSKSGTQGPDEATASEVVTVSPSKTEHPSVPRPAPTPTRPKQPWKDGGKNGAAVPKDQGSGMGAALGILALILIACAVGVVCFLFLRN